jgi:hypothetical protein
VRSNTKKQSTWLSSRQTTKLPPLRITPGKSVSQLRCIFVSRPAATSVNQRTVTVVPSEFEAARLGSNLRRAVNKCNLSTGENGEFAGKSVAFDADPRGSGCSPSDVLLETERPVDPRPAECLGYGRLGILLLSTKTAPKVGVGECWLPKKALSNRFLLGSSGRNGATAAT